MPKKIDIDAKDVIDSYRSGMSLNQVAKVYCCSPTPIKRILRESGVNMRVKGGSNNYQKTINDPKKRICCCCGIRQVPTKPVSGVMLTRLCERCYREAEHRRCEL